MTAVQIYSASAGSGKTFTLVREYLKILFRAARYGNYTAFRKVLAITFTNKATEEMKQRIIGTLKGIAAGTQPDMAAALKEVLPEEIDLQEQADKILIHILHDFSSFNIITIDSFFQEIVRSFARELDLPLNFEIEMQSDNGIDYAVEKLTGEIGFDETLTQWLEEYAYSLLRDDKNWNFSQELKTTSKEIFDEAIDLKALHENAGRMADIRKELLRIVSVFLKRVKTAGEEVLEFMNASGLPEDCFRKDFKGNMEKVVTDFSSLVIPLGVRISRQLTGEEGILLASAAKNYSGIASTFESGAFIEKTTALYQLLTEEIRQYITAMEALRNIYAVGVLSRINEYLKRFRSERNMLFISDAARMINGFIELGDMPFLFEKIGTRLKYVFVDEFQDTSNLQWRNILPVLHNILGASSTPATVLLVGDAKQSIYRWRGGDYQLLTGKAATSLQPFETQVHDLDTNYRSLPEIVSFNNLLFKTAIEVVRASGPESIAAEMDETYATVHQEALPSAEQGYVQISVLPPGNVEEWKAGALETLVGQIGSLRNKGFADHDMAILVRTRTEGVAISRHLQSLGIEVLSQETLLLKHDSGVRLMLAGLHFIHNDLEPLNYVNLLWQYHKSNNTIAVEQHELFRDFNDRKLLTAWLPGLSERISKLKEMPFFQIFDTLVELLEVSKSNLFVSHFRQLAFDFFKRESGSLSDFLDWWETQEDKAAAQLENGRNKINILTIHKAKGLEFPAVLIPFCDWGIFDKMKNDLVWLQDEGLAKNVQLPYRPLKSMMLSIFEQEILDERTLVWMDNINTLYVALTRPEKALFLTFSEKNANGLPSTIAALMGQILKQWGFSGTGTFEWGELPNAKVPLAEEETAPFIQQPVPLDKLPEIHLKESFESNRTRIGDMVHLALYFLSKNDPEAAFLKASNSEKFSAAELEEGRRHFFTLVHNETFKAWLSEMDDTWDEQDIWYNGALVRPDKILRIKDRYLILDYKTGEPQDHYHQKVRSYMQAVGEVFSAARVEGYIIYSESGTIVQVT